MITSCTTVLCLYSVNALLVNRPFKNRFTRITITKRLVANIDEESNAGLRNQSQPSSQLFGKSLKSMLDEAQNLRLQAEQMEITNKDLVKRTTNKTDVMETLPSVALNATPKSVLGSREQEVSKRSELVSKLNGEFIKARYKQNSTVNFGAVNVSDEISLYPSLKGVTKTSDLNSKYKFSLEAFERLGSLPSVDDLYNDVSPWWTRFFLEQAVKFIVTNWDTLGLGSNTSKDICTLTALTEFLHIAEILEETSEDLSDLEFEVLLKRFLVRKIFFQKLKNRGTGQEMIYEKTYDAMNSEVEELMTALQLKCISLIDRIQAINRARKSTSDTTTVLKQPDLETEAVLMETLQLLKDAQKCLSTSGTPTSIDISKTQYVNSSLLDFNSIKEEEYNFETSDAKDLRSLFEDSTVQNLMKQIIEEDGDSASRLIKDYFDLTSRQSGAVISREGAGAIQNELLKSIYVVNEVKLNTGAAVYTGRILGDSTEIFVKTLREKIATSTFKDEIGFLVLRNDKSVDMSGGLERAAIDSLLNSGPAVVIYPKSWESNIALSSANPLRRVFRILMFVLSLISSASFSASCFDLFSPTGPLAAEVPSLPDDFIYLTIAPILIQFISLFVETSFAYLKGITTTINTIPSFTLPIFGSRVTYVTLPSSRNDLFDISAIGIGSALLTSLITMYTGLQLSVDVSESIMKSFPTISLSLLKLNTIVAQFVNYQFPGIFDSLTSNPTSEIHIHWLAIAGAMSFVYNTFQLFPLDNSPGSKMSFAYLGPELYNVLTLFAGLFKGIFLITLVFASGGTMPLTKPRIFGDFVVASQITADSVDTPIAADSLSEITEGRKILFSGFVFLLFFSVFNYADIAADANTIVTSILNFGKSLTTSPTPSVTSPIVNF